MAPPAAVGASSAAAIAGLSKVGSPLAENEMVGASGAFNALAEAVKSGPSAGRPEAEAPGGADAAPESRLGLGGGASLRDSGGVESCVPCTPSSTPLPASARAAASTTESAEPGLHPVMPAKSVARGDEIGMFHLGSTAVVLLEPGLSVGRPLGKVRFGESLLRAG